jgi:uncharacterized membrane protein
MKNKIWLAIFATAMILLTVFAASAQTFSITSVPSTNAIVGQQYSYQLTANITNVTYALVSGPGTVTQNGLYTYTPTSAGTFSTSISATHDSEVINQAFTVSAVSQISRMLEIEKVDVRINGKRDTLTSPGTIDDEAELGDEIEITVKIQNNFNIRNDDTTIRNIEMEISSDLDDADGLDEGISRLEAGRDAEMTVSFTLDPQEVLPSDAPFDITIYVEGKTRDGTLYSDSWTLRLDMDVKSRDLYILRVEASPLSVSSCTENRIRITTEIRNIGTRDLSDAAIRIRVPDLGITKFISGIELDSEDDDQFSDFITIPRGITAGTYQLDIDALPQRTVNTATSIEALQINVLQCATNQNPDNNQGNGSTDTPNDNANGGTIIIPDVVVIGTPVASAVGKSGVFGLDGSLYVILLAVLVLLLILILVAMIIRIRD